MIIKNFIDKKKIPSNAPGHMSNMEAELAPSY